MMTLLLALALQDVPPLPPPEKPASSADGIQELTELWKQAIDLCRGEKKDDLQKLIEKMEMTRAEMTALFGEEKTSKVYGEYRDNWKTRVRTEAAADLIARFKRSSWNDVEVWCLNGTEAKQGSDDRGVLDALADKEAKVYNVRLKQKDKKDGFVLKCFVRTTGEDGGWRMGLKIGRNLSETVK
jgi:hypothetical protein